MANSKIKSSFTFADKGENKEEIQVTAIFENILLKLPDLVFLSINSGLKEKKIF